MREPILYLSLYFKITETPTTKPCSRSGKGAWEECDFFSTRIVEVAGEAAIPLAS